MRATKVFIIAILCLFVAVSVNAASVVANLGYPNSSGAAPIQIDSDRVVTFSSDSGIKAPYEKATTSDTITAMETGKTFIVAPTSESTFILPDADVGMMFKFVAVDGDASGTKKFILDPQSTDRFRGAVNSTATSTFAAGDSLISPGATGDSITIFCGEDTYWDVVDRTGTFVDNN